jgi:T5SS/PEP-CTERM-associated repeat protein
LADLDVGSGLGSLGELKIENGGSVTSLDGYIGKNASSFGAVTVTGTGSTWTNTRDLTVGDLGTAVLDILEGGSAATFSAQIGGSLDSNGKVTVSDSGSHLSILADLDVGSGLGSLGELKIENGGSVSAGQGFIGRSNLSSGLVTITGSGSALSVSSELNVGASTLGMGELRIQNGGSLSSYKGALGLSSGSSGTVIVNGIDSIWTVSSDLEVGFFGSGELRIENGGSVFNQNGFIAKLIESSGSVTVAGAGSQWNNSGYLTLGGQFPHGPGSAFATGELTVGDGGLVRVGDTLQVNNGSSVNLQVGGTITVPRFQLSGSLELNGTLVADDFWTDPGATVTGSGTVVGNVYNNGMFTPGNSPGVLTIDGDFTQYADGQLLIEIAGLNAGSDYDQLFASGTASIEGMFLFQFLDGFAPLKGDIFDFLITSHVQANSQVQVQIQNLLPGFEYDLSFIDGAYRLTALNNATFVPEPGSAILLLSGLYALMIRGKRAS